MALTLISNVELSAEDKLKLRGLQTDPNGEVLGGHRAIFDFASLGADQSAGAIITNLVYGGEDAVVGNAITNVLANKGIAITSSGTNYKVTLGNTFKPSQMGAAPSYVISMWLQRTGTQTYGRIGGVADASGWANFEWHWMMGSAGTSVQPYVATGGDTLTLDPVPLSVNTPTLVTVYTEKQTPTTYKSTVYSDTTKVGTKSGIYTTYSATNPATLGYSPANGTANFPGIYHRAQCFQVDPVIFDIDAFLAAEVAKNGDRFDLS